MMRDERPLHCIDYGDDRKYRVKKAKQLLNYLLEKSRDFVWSLRRAWRGVRERREEVIEKR